jgi:hypothetical protein
MAQNAMLNFSICTKHAAYDIVVGGIQCCAETKKRKNKINYEIYD